VATTLFALQTIGSWVWNSQWFVVGIVVFVVQKEEFCTLGGITIFYTWK